MTTTTRQGGTTSGFTKFLFIFIIIAVTGLVVAMTLAHAGNSRHPTGPDIASRCNQNNYQLHLYNPETKRDAYACELDGIWSFTIKGEAWEGDDVVTAFPRKSAQSVEDAIRYLQSKGYIQP